MESKSSGVAVLVTDLIFQTKITSTAKALGVPSVVVREIARLETVLSESRPRLLLVDLAVGPAALEAIPMAKTGGLRVIAFVSHVEVELARQATQAGADQVMPRSRFSAQLADILTNLPD